MAREVIWSKKAQEDRKKILLFWIENNSTRKYSIELNTLFTETVKLISLFPKIGKITSDKKIRVKAVKEYLIFYELKKSKIILLTIWDSRRNPDNLNI